MTVEEMRKHLEQEKAEKRKRQREARIRKIERRAEKAGRTFEEQKAFDRAIAKERKAQREAEIADRLARRAAEWEAGAEQRAIERAKAEETRKAYEEERAAKKKEKWDRINQLEKVWAEDPEVLALMPKVGMKAMVWWREYGTGSTERFWIGPALGEVVEVDETYRMAWFKVRICNDAEHEACEWDDDEDCDPYSCFRSRRFLERRVKDKIHKVWKGVGVRKPTVWRNGHYEMKRDGIVNVELILEHQK